MSEFSEKCKYFINQSGESVYQMSKRTGLDWTTLQKMTQGKRLPGKKFVEDLCDYLALNKTEREELMRLYQIEKYGKKAYDCQKEIEDFLDDFYSLRVKLEESVYRRHAGFQLPSYSDSAVTPLLTYDDIRGAVRYVIHHIYESEEEPRIYMDACDAASAAMEQLVYEDKYSKKKAHCTQLIKFARMEDIYEGALENVEILRMIFPFALTFQSRYNVYYFYARESSLNCVYDLWPHYIVTGQNVLLLSGDEKNGLLIEDRKIAMQYMSEVRKIRENGKNLLAGAGAVENVIRLMQENVAQEDFVISYETAPCLAELLASIRELCDLEQNELVKSYMRMYDRNSWTEDSGKKIIYSFNGMEKFLRTGILPGVAGEIIPQLPEELRRIMADGYVEGMREKKNGYLLKESSKVSQYYMSIILYKPNIIAFISMEKEMHLGAVIMEESSLFKVFRNYFENLIDEGQTYSPEESSEQFQMKCKEIWESAAE